jgi:hypothetical protein
MATSVLASLQLMKLIAFTDETFQTPVAGLPYSVMMNPDSIKWGRSIEYNEQQAPDSSAPSQKYKSTPSEKLSFDIVIDCTGIVDSLRVVMLAEITALENVVYTYNGTIHRPNFVKIIWGLGLSFNGVLTSFDTTYTLFSPAGNPLRAKVSLAFSEYIAPTTVAVQDGDESPDMTHMVDVVQDVNLPQLCQQVWGDNSYYVQVARFNGLNKFRNLKGISRLIFPPIVQTQ